MQPLLPNSAAVDPAVEPRAGSVADSPPALPTAERRHFVFGLFGEIPKAEYALRRLRAAHFEASHILLMVGSTGNGDSVVPVWNRIPASAPFGSLAGILHRSETAASMPHDDGLAPRIAQQIAAYLDRGGAVLVVAIQTAEQERTAARTLLTCKCDVLLTHEMAVRT